MRRILLAMVTLIFVVASALPAAAGGWAVTTIVEMPERFVPGQNHDVVFEIRQHGTTLVTDMDGVAIVLSRLGGEELLTFEAVNRGTQWVAKVRSPAEGSWTWAVQPGWFATYDLGTFPLATPPGGIVPDAARLGAGAAVAALGMLLLLLLRRRSPQLAAV